MMFSIYFNVIHVNVKITVLTTERITEQLKAAASLKSTLVLVVKGNKTDTRSQLIQLLTLQTNFLDKNVIIFLLSASGVLR